MSELTSLQRIEITLSHQEADRVPFLLPAVMHGAKELGLSIESYFSSAKNVIEGQCRILKKLGHDAVIGAFYGALDLEDWGCKTIFIDNGPPNAGQPIIRKPEDILSLAAPRVKEAKRLQEVLKTIRGLKERVGGEKPVVGSVIAPFSLPIMQMGFEHYLDLIYDSPELFWRLMKINEDFCVEWANAQLDAGANMIVYADPVSSPTIVPKELYKQTGYLIAKRTLARIHGGVATSFASGRSLPMIDDVVSTGSIAVTAGYQEDLAALKSACRGRLALLGNLNPVEMRTWSWQEAETNVKTALAKGAQGGGFILSDIHGDIPWQVSGDTLVEIAEAAKKWGKYPMRWVESEQNETTLIGLQ